MFVIWSIVVFMSNLKQLIKLKNRDFKYGKVKKLCNFAKVARLPNIVIFLLFSAIGCLFETHQLS